jgi:WD40 repeat protein
MALHFWNIRVHGAVGMVRTMRLGEGSYVVGSASDCEIAALGEGLAAHHALLTLFGERVSVEPLGEVGETFLGAERIESARDARCPVTVKLGSVRLDVEFAGFSADGGLSPEQTQRLVHPDVVRMRRAEDGLECTQRITPQVHVPPVSLSAFSDGATLSFQMPAAELFSAKSVPVHMDYVLNGEIARGGMGRIFAAQDPGLERHVAVKVSGSTEAGARAQFCHEARVLAELTHPNIVPVYHLGNDAQGRPFYAMRLVEGRTLREVLRQVAAGDPQAVAHFSRARLLRVFRKVCDAVAFAHDRGFIHRDLKPENVMVGEFGEVLVMDWGLAKALPNRGAAPEASAHPGFIEGTPQYMSPEQASGEYATLDERSDIYALGGILYALLTLRPPVEGGSVAEVLDKVRNGQTTKMMECGNAALFKERGPLRMKAGIPDALCAVTRKAMARDKGRRYASVLELAQDLESYQNGFATVAEEAGLTRLAQLFVKRHKMVSSLLAVLLVGASLFTVRLARSEKRARASALDALRQAAIAADNALQAAANAERADSQARIAGENARQAAANAERADNQARIAAENERLARQEREEARFATASAHIAAAEASEQALDVGGIRRALEAVPADLRDQQWRYLRRASDASVRTFASPAGVRPMALRFHPTKPDVLLSFGHQAATKKSFLREISISSGEGKDLLEISSTTAPAFAVSPDAKRAALMRVVDKPGDPAKDLFIDVWSLESRRVVLEIPLPKPVSITSLKFSEDGLFLLAQASSGYLAVFDAAVGELLWDISEPDGLSADFIKRSGHLGVYLGAKWMMKFAVRTGAISREAVRVNSPRLFHHRHFYKWAADPEWGYLYVIGKDVCRKMETYEGRVEFEIRLPQGAANMATLVYMPERNMIATLSWVSDSGAVLQLWNEWDGTAIGSYPVEIPRLNGLEWSLLYQPGNGVIPDRLLVGRAGEIKVFEIPKIQPESSFGELENPPAGGFVFLDQSWKVLLQERRKNTATTLAPRMFDTRRPQSQMLSEHGITDNRSFFPSTSRDGKRVVLYHRLDPELKVFTVAGHQLANQVLVPVQKGSTPPQMSPDGSLIWFDSIVYSAGTRGVFSKMDRKGLLEPSERQRVRWLDNQHVVEVATFSNVNGASKEDVRKQSLILWDVATGKPLHQIPAPSAVAVSVAPDGTQIAEAGLDMKVRIRAAETLEVLGTLRVHDGPLQDVAWHPKLPVLATCSDDFFVRIWDLSKKELVEEYGIFSAVPTQLSWSPDGSRLSVHCASGALHLFDPQLPKAP